VPEKAKGRDLLTLLLGHGHALHGTLSGTPEWACLQAPAVESKLSVSRRTAAEATRNQLVFVVVISFVFSERVKTTTNVRCPTSPVTMRGGFLCRRDFLQQCGDAALRVHGGGGELHPEL
jgi:hypothetical protein